jgi:nitrate/nitrite transporter NarK
MAIPLGSVTGMAVTGYMFDEKTDIKGQMFKMFLGANIVITCIFLAFRRYFHDKPPTPPSAAALEASPPRDIVQSYHELKDNSNFIVIAVYYFFMFGSYTTFGNLQSEIFKPFGLKIYEMAILGCISLFFGIVSALTVGKVLDRTRKYKFIMQLIPFIMVINLLVFVAYALP